MATGDQRLAVKRELAHLVTGCIAAGCCYRTGGQGPFGNCDCGEVAEQLMDHASKVIELLSTLSNHQTGVEPC